MTQFKEGTKVITIVDGELKTGHIARVYGALKTAIVRFDDTYCCESGLQGFSTCRKYTS